MKKLLKTLALLAFIVFSLNCQARKKTHSGIPKWIVSKTKGTKVARINADFSAILTDDRVQFIGFIGSDYQNLKVSLQKVSKQDNTRYNVSGISVVRGNRCHFKGTISIIANREFVKPTYGIDDSMKGKFKRRGCCIAKYNLKENVDEKGGGCFTGYLLFFWYETKQDTIMYDDIDDYSDSYCNNLYSGTWQSYKTKKRKPCAWGQYRIPNSGDLDIGAAEFSVNPKYLQNGWQESDDSPSFP